MTLRILTVNISPLIRFGIAESAKHDESFLLTALQ